MQRSSPIQRSRAQLVPYLKRDRCARGHIYTPSSTYVRVRGTGTVRCCRICNREAKKRVRSLGIERYDPENMFELVKKVWGRVRGDSISQAV